MADTPLGYRAGGTINICRFVVADTANPNGALQASDSTHAPLGISTDQVKTRPDPDVVADPNVIAAVTGDAIRVHPNGKKGVSLYCNAAWAAGDLLMADASGFGIVATSGNWYGARAQTAGTVGSLCTVDVFVGQLN